MFPTRFLGLVCVVLLAMVLVGCESTPSRYSSQPLGATMPTVTVPDPLIVAPAASLPPAPPETNTPASLAETLASPLLAWPKEWVNVWVPLESWGRFNGLGKPAQLSPGAEAVYLLQSTNGAVLVKMGSHSANISGLEYGLGFAPRLIRGLPYVHSLDAQKTLQVLLGVLWPLPARSRTVVIDAGHGGRDSGARSVVTRAAEKDYTLDWALRVQHCLASSQWNVVLTRTNDADLSLTQRVAIADRVSADIFVSLHLNSGGANRHLAGVETYCLTPTGMPSNLIREYDDDPREAHPNNQFDEHNVQLATRLHRSILEATGAADRGVRRARFMTVLRGQQRPAVLVEGGYLTNAEEARKLADPNYRQLLAEAVARALTDQ